MMPPFSLNGGIILFLNHEGCMQHPYLKTRCSGSETSPMP
jgi:hypothetical protein